MKKLSFKIGDKVKISNFFQCQGEPIKKYHASVFDYMGFSNVIPIATDLKIYRIKKDTEYGHDFMVKIKINAPKKLKNVSNWMCYKYFRKVEQE